MCGRLLEAGKSGWAERGPAAPGPAAEVVGAQAAPVAVGVHQVLVLQRPLAEESAAVADRRIWGKDLRGTGPAEGSAGGLVGAGRSVWPEFGRVAPMAGKYTLKRGFEPKRADQ